MTGSKILIVEDDETLGMALEDALKQDGYRVSLEKDGAKALARVLKDRFDLVLLDLMLPNVDGFTICRRMRAEGNRTPVLMLTARGREDDRVKGLDAGADDYLIKPFSMRELQARVRARLRAAEITLPTTVKVRDAEIDLAALVIRRDGANVSLTKTEADLLKVFLKHPGQVLTRKRFLDEVWGLNHYPTTRTVDMHIARLREKLGDEREDAPLIATVHGVGYRFDPPAAPSAAK